MAYSWSTTITHPGGVAIYAGVAPSPQAARAAAADAGAAHAHRTTTAEQCLYMLRVQDAITAIISTGAGEGELPEHDHAAALLSDLYSAPTPDIAWPAADVSYHQHHREDHSPRS